jgi:hypothetical protein
MTKTHTPIYTLYCFVLLGANRLLPMHGWWDLLAVPCAVLSVWPWLKDLSIGWLATITFVITAMVPVAILLWIAKESGVPPFSGRYFTYEGMLHHFAVPTLLTIFMAYNMRQQHDR